jgi:hypothetical protein
VRVRVRVRVENPNLALAFAEAGRMGGGVRARLPGTWRAPSWKLWRRPRRGSPDGDGQESPLVITPRGPGDASPCAPPPLEWLGQGPG